MVGTKARSPAYIPLTSPISPYSPHPLPFPPPEAIDRFQACEPGLGRQVWLPNQVITPLGHVLDRQIWTNLSRPWAMTI
jgi:hypothetical protein